MTALLLEFFMFALKAFPMAIEAFQAKNPKLDDRMIEKLKIKAKAAAALKRIGGA